MAIPWGWGAMKLGYHFVKVKANANCFFRICLEGQVKHLFTQFDLEWQNYLPRWKKIPIILRVMMYFPLYPASSPSPKMCTSLCSSRPSS